jgi:multidrug resistance efflux pump
LKIALVILAGVVVVGGAWVYARREAPPPARAVRVARSTVVQALLTNGRVEALDSYAVNARAPVLVTKVLVQQGDLVRRGQLLAEVDDQAAREAVTRAEAELAIARADRHLVERGASAASLADLDAAIGRARLNLESARQEVSVLQRLVEKQAVPRASLQEQQLAHRRAETELAALEKKRSALLGPEDRERIAGRIREAEAAVAQAQSALRRLELRSPAEGLAYFVALRPGAFYNASELAARIGTVDRVRVRVYVDEPELGPIRKGQPIRITWDGLAGQQWHGTVERLPAAVERVGTRSVGEVLCVVENPGRRLLPEATVNVNVETGRGENVLVIPREAVLRQGGDAMVLVVNGEGVVARQAVRLGIYDTTRIQVLEGLQEDQVVLLPGERTYAAGEHVQVQMGPKVGT